MGESRDGYRMGGCLYQAEVEELTKRLDAKGVMIIVVKGNRNKEDVEFSTSITENWKDFVLRAFAYTALKMIEDFSGFDPLRKRL